VSQKQIEANRENAKLSTGPVTQEGKEVSKLNAMRHGILSKHVFIATGGKITEYEEFNAFRETFFEEMQPVGALETLLVDRLFTTFWRLQRLHIAESGFIRKQTESHFMQSFVERSEAEGRARNDAENGFFRRMRTSIGCLKLAEGWQVIYESIKEKGLPLSKGKTDYLDKEFGGNSGFYKAEVVGILNWIVANNGGTKPMTEKDKKAMEEQALTCAKDLWDMFKGFSEVLEWDEKDVQNADLQSKMIPPLEELEKLQRYDAHLQRVLMQTLHEYQRIQSVRLGRPAPLSAALDINLNSDNGFVS